MYYGEIKNCDIANGEGVRAQTAISSFKRLCLLNEIFYRCSTRSRIS